MDNYFEQDQKLKAKYKEWYQKLKEIRPDFFADAECVETDNLSKPCTYTGYSNPYYTAIPYRWYESDVRILCLGEEGFGDYGCGKGDKNPIPPDDIHAIQTLNWRYLASNACEDELYLSNIYTDIKDKADWNGSQFWNRLRRLRKYGPCAWSNLDKIHVLGTNCKLSAKDRKALHQPGIKIIFEEISILNPTHVALFGWYKDSIEQEIPKLYESLYPADHKGEPIWKKNVLTFTIDGIHYIAAYHPSWGAAQKKIQAGEEIKNYEKWVIEEFEKTLSDHKKVIG